jgi:hypothetical protein
MAHSLELAACLIISQALLHSHLRAADKESPPAARRKIRMVADEGIVLDEKNQPVADAEVFLFQSAPSVAARTGRDGRFTAQVPFRRSVQPMGIARNAAGDRQSYFRQDRKSDVQKPIRVVLRPAREIAVEVVDANGQPVAGAHVVVPHGLFVATLASWKIPPDRPVWLRFAMLATLCNPTRERAHG